MGKTSSINIGFGGGCHWCTEGVFSQITGVHSVDQGWIKSISPNDELSEAVIVSFDPNIISLKSLIYIHLQTHSSTSEHRFRSKYRSAIYFSNELQKKEITTLLHEISLNERQNYITKVIPFIAFERNQEKYLDYYSKNPDAPFCKRYISPKLDMLQKKHPDWLK